MKVGYLGPKGTFSQLAAIKYVETLKKGELIPFNSIFECIMAVENGAVDYSVVPIENSIEGTVTYTIDTLIFDSNVTIEYDLILPIHHCLVGKEGTKKEDIKTIYSHPQALAQCRKSLSRSYENLKTVSVTSTAEGAKMVSESLEKVGALCNYQAAKEFELNILEENMQDDFHNETRFFIIKKETETNINKAGKTTIIFGTDNKPGELYKILDIINIWDINMTKIESRPRKDELGQYVFYIDIESTKEEDMQDALKMIKRKTSFFKYLGTYKTL